MVQQKTSLLSTPPPVTTMQRSDVFLCLCALLCAVPLQAQRIAPVEISRTPAARDARLPRHRVLVLGNQDSLGIVVAEGIRARLVATTNGTNIRIVPQSDVYETLTSGLPVNWELTLSSEDAKELGKLLNVQLLVAIRVERTDGGIRLQAEARAPISAPPRQLTGAIVGSVASVVDSVVKLIQADTTYRRLRMCGGGPLRSHVLRSCS